MKFHISMLTFFTITIVSFLTKNGTNIILKGIGNTGVTFSIDPIYLVSLNAIAKKSVVFLDKLDFEKRLMHEMKIFGRAKITGFVTPLDNMSNSNIKNIPSNSFVPYRSSPPRPLHLIQSPDYTGRMSAN